MKEDQPKIRLDSSPKLNKKVIKAARVLEELEEEVSGLNQEKDKILGEIYLRQQNIAKLKDQEGIEEIQETLSNIDSQTNE